MTVKFFISNTMLSRDVHLGSSAIIKAFPETTTLSFATFEAVDSTVMKISLTAKQNHDALRISSHGGDNGDGGADGGGSGGVEGEDFHEALPFDNDVAPRSVP